MAGNKSAGATLYCGFVLFLSALAVFAALDLALAGRGAFHNFTHLLGWMGVIAIGPLSGVLYLFGLGFYKRADIPARVYLYGGAGGAAASALTFAGLLLQDLLMQLIY